MQIYIKEKISHICPSFIVSESSEWSKTIW